MNPTLAITLALVYGFLNGYLNSSAIVATIISSRALSPRLALLLIAVSEFCGPFVIGVAVARTIAGGIVPAELVDLPLIMSALSASILWSGITWLLRIPGSSSHSLIGGLVGAASVSIGFNSINLPGLLTVLVVLFASPIIGLVMGFLIMRLIFLCTRRATMRINIFFKRSQILTGMILGLSHGANDAQKTIGMITMILIATGMLPGFQASQWVTLVSAGALALGVSTGSYRLIHTLGGRLYKIRPVNGFATQITAAGVVLAAALVGSPVSTTHVVSSAILGVGSAERINKVRWGLAKQILIAWILTIPISAFLSILFYWLYVRIF